MRETCLVAGGAGFIGSWLCENLIEDGYKVICVDNFVTGNRSNVSGIKGDFSVVNADVTQEVETKGKIDYVFHLASPASPVHYQKYPIETLLANSLGTLKLLQIAKKNNAAFLYASSSEVYGDPKEHPQKESYWGNVNPNGPRSCYDEGKRFSESLITNFSGVDAKIVRIFNTYGPKMNKEDGRVMPNFINQAIRNNPLTVYGDGKQTRSFCYVTDMVAALKKVMFSKKTTGQVMNVGNPNEITMLELAKIVLEKSASKSELTFETLPTDDPSRRKPDISKITNLTGWKPSVDIVSGVGKTIKYFRGV